MSVTVYTRPGCVQCTATIREFQKKGISPSVVDIDKCEDGSAKVMELGYRSLPVVVAGEAHWGGFNPDNINKACA